MWFGMFVLSCFGPESGALRVCVCVCLCTFLLVFCIVCSPWQRWLKGGHSIIIAAVRERKKRKESWGNCASGAGWPDGDRIMAIWLFFLFLTVVLPCFQQTTSHTQREGSLYRECKHCTGSGKHIIFMPFLGCIPLFNPRFLYKYLLLQTY